MTKFIIEMTNGKQFSMTVEDEQEVQVIDSYPFDSILIADNEIKLNPAHIVSIRKIV